MDEKTDELARNAALHVLGHRIELEDEEADGDRIADMILRGHAVTWEREINGHGRAVRRYVLRGAWEVDPEAVQP